MNRLTDAAKDMFRYGGIDWESDRIMCALVNNAAKYIRDGAQDPVIADVPSDAIITPPIELTGKAVVDGAMDADDVTFPDVPEDSLPVTDVILYRASDGFILGIFDDWPDVYPNGGDIEILWDNGIHKIFRPPSRLSTEAA